MEVLESCPWCDSAGRVVIGTGYWVVECSECGATGPKAELRNTAIEKLETKAVEFWNDQLSLQKGERYGKF